MDEGEREHQRAAKPRSLDLVDHPRLDPARLTTALVLFVFCALSWLGLAYVGLVVLHALGVGSGPLVY